MSFNPHDNILNNNINALQEDPDSAFNRLALGDFQSEFNILLKESGMSFDSVSPGYSFPVEKEKKSTYYSIESTDNLYVLKYSQKELENLGDRFIIVQPNQTIHNLNWRIISSDWRSGVFHILDEVLIKETLEIYKKQLDNSPKERIDDIHLKTFSDPLTGYPTDILYFIQDYLNDLGLRATKDSKIALKIIKPKAKEQKLLQSDLNNTLSLMINHHMQSVLGLHGSFKIHSKNLVATLKFFKAAAPNVTYDELLSNTPYITDLKGIKEIWNNPDSFKPKSSKEKK
jgi:hypothetical protein